MPDEEQTVRLRDLVRLDLKPGELLAVFLPEGSTVADANYVAQTLSDILAAAGLGWPFAVVPAETRLVAVNGAQTSCRCATHTHPSIERDVMDHLRVAHMRLTPS